MEKERKSCTISGIILNIPQSFYATETIQFWMSWWMWRYRNPHFIWFQKRFGSLNLSVFSEFSELIYNCEVWSWRRLKVYCTEQKSIGKIIFSRSLKYKFPFTNLWNAQSTFPNWISAPVVKAFFLRAHFSSCFRFTKALSRRL